jgi:hypothetical protein
VRDRWGAIRWVVSLVLPSVVFGTLAIAAEPAPDSFSRVSYGFANQDPPYWEKKPRASVLVTFCVREAPPPKGSRVTMVPASPALPALVVRVARSKRLHHDPCIVVSAEPVTDPAWRDVGWEKGGAWSFPLLLIVDGEHPKARPLNPRALPAAMLPPDTKYLHIAADIDGDGTVDAILRTGCGDGRRDCEDADCDCKEVWIRTENRWRQLEQRCGD